MAKNKALQQRNELRNLVKKLAVKDSSVLLFHESLQDQVMKMAAAGSFKGIPPVPILFVKNMAEGFVDSVENPQVALKIEQKPKVELAVVQPDVLPGGPQPLGHYKAYAMVRKNNGQYPSLYVMRVFEMHDDKVVSVSDAIEDMSGIVVGKIIGALEDNSQ